MAMHEAIKPLAWLKGTWKTVEPAFGKFPTIKDFRYEEEMSFKSIGQAMLNYSARSWYPDTKKPLHYEVGFLQITPDTNKVHLLLAHNFGVTTIEDGCFEDKFIKLKTSHVARSLYSTKSPPVWELQREFKVEGECLFHTLRMATTATPELEDHLCAIYAKQKEKDE